MGMGTKTLQRTKLSAAALGTRSDPILTLDLVHCESLDLINSQR